MIDCALPERDSYGNRLRGLDRVGWRCPTHSFDCEGESKLAWAMIALWTRRTLESIDHYLDDMEQYAK